MLDVETRRRIDNCRDILVGKVPDPKSQVEQVTIALIYKFMDDMDQESIDLGGVATFFVGEYEKYTWSQMFDPKLGGFEMLNLYSEAILKMNHNPNIPQLFRDIFKNAYLPYRDPETLKSFLKEINEFHYDHSERLGDAFEYLLSVLGSQGDAGQFRTPRHIIDFMVKVINPQKQETVLDPACGTAGFLISAYKHILEQNTQDRSGDLLTQDERSRLINQFTGYDISPDMVRLSLVNLYLHGFTQPKVYEYDTLTSDSKWDETADVILANPPFMTPKGGIRPHSRFSVKANRSEVLFVDYMMEHLHTSGRAAIIVPEGIIFQSANAYKALRKLMVDSDYLYAVVSLPSGIFQPYSGVKTSILFMDKLLAKKTSDILFVKVQNDGFDLGAQRRKNDGSQLELTATVLDKYKASILAGQVPEFNVEESSLAHVVMKEKIAAAGDFILSGDRYKETLVHKNQKWPLVELGKVCEKINDNLNPQDCQGLVQYVGLENIEASTGRLCGLIETDYSNIKSAKTKFLVGDILYGRLRPNLNKVTLIDFNGICSTDIFVLRCKENMCLPRFLSNVIRMKSFNDKVLDGLRGAQLPRIGFDYFSNLEIPLPPLSVQKEIVAEIEGYQKIIDGARQVLENYKPRIAVDENWPMVALGKVIELISGQHIESEKYSDIPEGMPYLTGPADFGDINPIITKYTKEPKILAQAGDILLTVKGSGIGKINILNIQQACISRQLMAIRAKNAEWLFIYHRLLMAADYFKEKGSGAAIPGLNRRDIMDLTIPLPPVEIQQKIVAAIEEERQLVDANKKLIELFENKIKVKIGEVWGTDPGDTQQ